MKNKINCFYVILIVIALCLSACTQNPAASSGMGSTPVKDPTQGTTDPTDPTNAPTQGTTDLTDPIGPVVPTLPPPVGPLVRPEGIKGLYGYDGPFPQITHPQWGSYMFLTSDITQVDQTEALELTMYFGTKTKNLTKIEIGVESDAFQATLDCESVIDFSLEENFEERYHVRFYNSDEASIYKMPFTYHIQLTPNGTLANGQSGEIQIMMTELFPSGSARRTITLLYTVEGNIIRFSVKLDPLWPVEDYPNP